MSKKDPKQWITCPIEEEYLGTDRKERREERKRKIAKDRSQYKKTDQDKKPLPKILTSEEKKGLKRGRVLLILSEMITVATEETTYSCTLRGALKKNKGRAKNLITIGDFVWFSPLPAKEGVIHSIEERTSFLSRAEALKQRREQLIAANIDQVFITTSVLSPPLKPTLIDRYIIAAEQGKMQPVIVVNKVDLLQDTTFPLEERKQQRQLLEEMQAAYSSLNIPCLLTSTKKKRSLSALKKQMKGKSSVFSGQSGVGKSSLINLLCDLTLKTATVIEKTRKGAHATTHAALLPLPFGGYCVDTPGIKSFGLWNLKKEEIRHYYSEMAALSEKCRYPNCEHRSEQECAVKKAVEERTLSALRYESYLQLFEQIEKKHFNR